jgi:cytochrome P450
LEGTAHGEERRRLNPFFSPERARSCQRMIHEEAVAAASGWPVGQPFPVHDRLMDLSRRIILRLLFGPVLPDGPLEAAWQALSAVLKSGGVIPKDGHPDHEEQLNRRLREARAAFDAALRAEWAARTVGPGLDGESLLGWFRESGTRGGFTPQPQAGVADEVLTILAAGHETTATALAWALYWLDQNREVLPRLLRDLPAEADPSIDLGASQYLDAVCREALRITPIVPITCRRTRVEVRIGGVVLPPGTVVAAAIYLTHHRPDLYPEPDRFRPERFLERVYSPYEYLPFGGGARRCIGSHLALVEMKVILAALLRRYAFTLTSRRPIIPARRTVTVAPSEGLPMVMTIRSGDDSVAQPVIR